MSAKESKPAGVLNKMSGKSGNTGTKETKQLTLFGEAVGGPTTELEFVRAYQLTPEQGDEFVMQIDGASHNDDSVIVYDNTEARGLVCYIEQHKDAEFKSNPDASRLAKAVVLATKTSVEDWADLVRVIRDAVASGTLTLTVRYGERGRLWTSEFLKN